MIFCQKETKKSYQGVKCLEWLRVATDSNQRGFKETIKRILISSQNI
jgi:hypothetical protein